METEVGSAYSSINMTLNLTSSDEYLQVSGNKILLYFLCAIDLITILGNLLIIVAVLKYDYLRSTANLLIASLAFADFLIGVAVLPTAISMEHSSGYWHFGRIWCDLWHAIDVFCSTASILNLCAISFDRYWAITKPLNYRFKMTKRVALAMIAFVWICASAISFPWLIWWRKVDPPFVENQCLFTSDSLFIVLSSFISFYLPCTIMVFTYIKIYITARRQVRGIRIGTKNVPNSKKSGKHRNTVDLRIHRGGALMKKSISNRMKTEHKAAKVLGIVMGIFVLCWLPFFVINILSALCMECIIYPEFVFPVVSWLGWVNSTLNPLVYACVSKQFREAFRRILCCSQCGEHSRAPSAIAVLSNGVINASFLNGEEDLTTKMEDKHLAGASPMSRF